MVRPAEGMFFMIKTPEPRKAIRASVEEKLRKNECLLCDGAASRRGLCNMHYQQYRSAMVGLPPEKRQVVEAELIREGKLAPDRQGQRLASRNVFRDFLRN